ncbi:Zn-dependent hydrolase [Clostridiaceae bacterium 35-E11]
MYKEIGINISRIKKNLEELSKFNATPGKGLTRLPFTKEAKEATEYIIKEMKGIGLDVRQDGAGSIIGRREGKKKDASVIMIGSHYDSVKNGGNFDGIAGIVAGLELIRAMGENDISTNSPIEIIATNDEEGVRFGDGFFGTRAIAGQLTQEEIAACKDAEGISIAQAMEAYGLDPKDIHLAARTPESIKAFFEIHVEQGPILEVNKKEIGLVQYIVGMHRFKVTIKGRPDHAGTTPMDMRIDPLDAASYVISKISGMAKAVGEGTVATVGALEVFPGAVNIVPSEVKFTVDVRSKKQEYIASVTQQIHEALKEVAQRMGVEYEIIEKLNVAPVKLSEKLMDLMKKNCEKLGFSKEIMLSGAGHDSLVMSEITDVGLIFVPSKNGRSHCPEEWTDYEAFKKGIEVVYHTILDIDQG